MFPATIAELTFRLVIVVGEIWGMMTATKPRGRPTVTIPLFNRAASMASPLKHPNLAQEADPIPGAFQRFYEGFSQLEGADGG